MQHIRMDVERISPDIGYDAICYKVLDEKGEIVWRTADKDACQRLVGSFNECEAFRKEVGELRTKLRHANEALVRMKARYRLIDESLKCIATCGTSQDCATCTFSNTCRSKTVVAIARATLHKIGQKIPEVDLGEKADKKRGKGVRK